MQGCIGREGTSEGAPEAVRQAVGGGYRSGWGRLLSVINDVDAGSWRQGDSGWAQAARSLLFAIPLWLRRSASCIIVHCVIQGPCPLQVSFQTPVSLNLGPAFGSSEGKLPSPGSVEACGLERHNSCGTLSPHRDRRLSNSSAAKASPALLQRRSGSVASMEGGWAPDWARRQCSLERQHLTLDAEGVLLDRSPPHLQLRQRHSYGSRPSPSNVLHADRVTDTSSVVSNLSSSYSFIEPPEDYPPFK